MKIFKTIFLALCALLINQAFGAHQLYADIDGISIPYGTKLELQMAQNVSTKDIAQGDMFQAYLTKDIYVNNKLILPAKTIFRGRVSKVIYSRAFSRPASLRLTLDHLVTTRGYQLPINSGIASNFDYLLLSDNSLTTNGNYFKATSKDLKRAGKYIPSALKFGASSGEHVFPGSQIIFVPLGLVGGTVACVSSGAYNIIANMFRHGDEIAIKKGTYFNIILLSTLDIPS